MLTHHFELLPIKSTAKIRNKPIPPLQLLLHYLTLSNKCNKNESKCNKIIIKASCSDPAACLASDYPSQARIRPRKAACGDHPAGLASDHPPQARIRLRKAACGDHRRLSKRLALPSANPSPQSRLRRPPAGLASDPPGSALSWQGYCFGYAVQVEKSLSPRRKLCHRC